MTEENKPAETQLATEHQDSPKHNESANDPSRNSEDARPSTSEDPNWKEVRSFVKELRSENEYLKKEISQLKHPVKQEEDPFDSLSEDDVVTVADMKRYANKVAKQTAQELYEKRSVQQEIEATPSKYSDYYDVIQYVEPLVKENPALMGAIEKAPNPREAAYRMAKMYLKSRDSNQVSAKKIEENLAKPKTSDSLSVGQSISSSQKSLSLDERAKIWQQSQDFASMR